MLKEVNAISFTVTKKIARPMIFSITRCFHHNHSEIRKMVKQFLDLNVFDHCMVADESIKRLRHVDATDGGCPCNNECYSTNSFCVL